VYKPVYTYIHLDGFFAALVPFRFQIGNLLVVGRGQLFGEGGRGSVVLRGLVRQIPNALLVEAFGQSVFLSFAGLPKLLPLVRQLPRQVFVVPRRQLRLDLHHVLVMVQVLALV